MQNCILNLIKCKNNPKIVKLESFLYHQTENMYHFYGYNPAESSQVSEIFYESLLMYLNFKIFYKIYKKKTF